MSFVVHTGSISSRQYTIANKKCVVSDEERLYGLIKPLASIRSHAQQIP